MRCKHTAALAILLAFLTGNALIFGEDWASRRAAASLSVHPNGTLERFSPVAGSTGQSPNGVFWCDYEIGAVTDEQRELRNFRFFEGEQLRFALERAPGSDLYISNTGFIAFMDMSQHFNRELTAHFYDKTGRFLCSKIFRGASLFGFSTSGKSFGAGAGEHFYLISLPEGGTAAYPPADQFSISEDDRRLALAYRDRVRIFSPAGEELQIQTGFAYPRKVAISSASGLAAVIDKRNLQVYSLAGGELLFRRTLSGAYSYRDLEIVDGAVAAGVHYREAGVSKGILRIFSPGGTLIQETESAPKFFQTFAAPPANPAAPAAYPEIPWPFVPFDSMHTVWNYYEQHMGLGSPTSSYMHQGLDIITPIGEPTYAVAPGIVKCVLTTGGAIYWRLATSAEQVAGFSRGWLYAHLIQNSIQVDVGDTVQLHDYLGDIIAWTADWGHIHFVEIEDSGLVWRYNDNEWGITYNPLHSLRSNEEHVAPALEPVFPYSKFGFCLNETSIYLYPDSLYGDIDIIAKVVDYVKDSPWQQPAYEIYYWVKRLPGGETVFPRTLGQRLNHSFDFYASGHYEEWAPLIYKRDATLPPSSWMSMERNFYHLLTNNNGDTLLALSEKSLAFPTYNYADGDYRIVIEAFDQYGNSTRDSMAVKFRNGITALPGGEGEIPAAFELRQNYPNPFNPATRIGFALPQASTVKIEVFNLLGERVATLLEAPRPAGYHEIRFDAGRLESGMYLCRMQAGNFSQTRKMLLLR